MEQDIIDFNKCPLSSRNGKYGGMAGSKEGIIYKDDFWIIKYPKNTNIWMYQIFHIPHHVYLNIWEATYIKYWDMMYMKHC